MPSPSDQYPETMLGENIPLERVRHALRMLNPDHQEVLVLRFGQRLSMKETADLMGKSVSAIKSLQFRALDTLRLILIEPEAHHG
jgi:RNA polymerase sigma-70 factor (ECF subfamily)